MGVRGPTAEALLFFTGQSPGGPGGVVALDVLHDDGGGLARAQACEGQVGGGAGAFGVGAAVAVGGGAQGVGFGSG
jgi:hypothetical protein